MRAVGRDEAQPVSRRTPGSPLAGQPVRVRMVQVWCASPTSLGLPPGGGLDLVLICPSVQTLRRQEEESEKWFQIRVSRQMGEKEGAQALSCVRLFVTPWAIAHQAPLVGYRGNFHRNFQARILEWVAISYSRRCS